MPDAVNIRTYHSPARAEQARRTRADVLHAAAALFAQRGYAATTMSEVARAAGVALDTVYTAVGRKPVLFRLLLESAISGTDEAVQAERRDYVQAIRSEPDAARKLQIYATALRHIQPRLAPLVAALQEAGATEPDLRHTWHEIAERRAGNMRLMANDLQTTGRTRPDLDRDEIADILWATNAPEVYLLLTRERGWTDERYETWLADTWERVLLASPSPSTLQAAIQPMA